MSEPTQKFTAKPCPGCGATSNRPFRPADKVCDSCARKLANYDKVVARVPEGLVERAIPSRAYNLPYLQDGTACSTIRTRTEALQSAFFKLLQLVTTPALRYWNCNDVPMFKVRDSVHNDTDVIVRVSPEVEKALQNLHAAISPALEESAEVGRHLGTNFLSRLASGDVSMKELNRL